MPLHCPVARCGRGKQHALCVWHAARGARRFAHEWCGVARFHLMLLLPVGVELRDGADAVEHAVALLARRERADDDTRVGVIVGVAHDLSRAHITHFHRWRICARK